MAFSSAFVLALKAEIERGEIEVALFGQGEPHFVDEIIGNELVHVLSFHRLLPQMRFSQLVSVGHFPHQILHLLLHNCDNWMVGKLV
jgi:hypothetical protein